MAFALSKFFLISFSVSIFASIFGIGGGVVYLPLFWKSGHPFNQAATYSLYFVAASSLSAANRYRCEQLIEWQIVSLFAPMAIVGAFLGGYYAQLVNTKILLAIFVASTLFISLRLLSGQSYSSPTKATIPLSAKKNWQALPLGLVAGTIAGLIGKGGGLLYIPIFLYLYQRPLKIAAANSIAIIFFTAIAGVAGHLFRGYSLPIYVIIAGLGGLIGAQIGAHIQVKTNPKTLRPAAGVFFLLVAIYLFYNGVLFPH